ncbi:sensor histidine kinase [Cohnella herbarum]|uniref:Histidine kinase n=1 Tax=Cohnella herbarum TaxID=2728023 RepID=A0A7Z2VP25_9BACL|nr:histidine kinase [Cohnella herbarum]QJD86891.1 histidine kinase [Cohnella herbarum]
MPQLWRRLPKLIADRSILTKLIASLFILVTPLYVFNYVITNIGADNNRKEIERALTSSLQSYSNILDGEVQRIQQMLNMSALDIAIEHVEVIKPDISYLEKAAFLSKVGPYLNRIQYSTRFVSDSIAYLPLMNTTVAKIGGNSSFQAESFEALKTQAKPFILWNDRLYMNAPFITSPGDKEGMLILAVQISEATVADYISKIMSFDRGGALLFDMRNTWEISANKQDSAGSEIKRRLLANAVNESRGYGPRVVTENIRGESYFIVYEPWAGSNVLLAAYAPESEIYDSLSIYKKYFYSFSLISILIIILFSLGLYKLIHKPLRMLIHAFRRVEIGQLRFSLAHRNEDEFGYLYRRFNNMTETLDNMVNVVYEQKLLNQRSELKRLQSQINPHFLYNNFFVLHRLVRSGNADKASRFTEYLGRYFQFVTRDASDEIKLEDDVLHAQTYVDIQSVCFDQRVFVKFEPLPEEIKQVMVPRLILQPLLENCFNHVFEKQLARGELSVSFHADGQYVRIDVEDNGKQLDDSQLETLVAKLSEADKQTEESTGMINVHRRLRLKFGDESGLVLSRSVMGGLKIQIVIVRKGGTPDAEAVDR